MINPSTNGPWRLKRITLTLARTKERPDGSTAHGYEFTAPITADGHISVAGWQEQRLLCMVRRFWEGEEEQHGFLVHRGGGHGGATWAFDYDTDAAGDEEAGYRFADHTFAVGDYVSIRESDGELLTFRVASVRDA